MPKNPNKDEWRKSVVLKPSQHASIIREIERREKTHEGKFSGVLRDIIVETIKADLEGKPTTSPSSQLDDIRKLILDLQASRPEPQDEAPATEGGHVRLFTLAKELGMESKDLIPICHEIGIHVKDSALASLSPEDAERVRTSAPRIRQQLAELMAERAELLAQLKEFRSLLGDIQSILRPDFRGLVNFVRRFEEAVGGAGDDPFEMLIKMGDYARALRDSGLKPGRVVSGKVTALDDVGAYIELPGKITGRLYLSSIPNHEGSDDISDFLSEGLIIDVEVLHAPLYPPSDITVKLASIPESED